MINRTSRDILCKCKMSPRSPTISIASLFLVINAPVHAQDAESAYRERYEIVGELTRATAVCASGNDEAKWFLKGLDAIGSAELRAFTKSFKDTTAGWMKAGAEGFNRRIMEIGIPAACAFARNERTRALQLGEQPISAGSARHDDQYKNEKTYDVVFTGSCKFKMLNRDQFGACDPNVTYTNYKIHRSAFEFSGDNGKALFVFEGGQEKQPDLENYYLKVDKVKIGTVADGKIDGAQTPVEGECHMRLNKDASEFYEVKCDVFDRNTRMVYNFYMTSITRFEKHAY